MHKLWLDLDGNLIPVQDSHEEWANWHGYELEHLLDAGLVRIQVTCTYLYLDFKVALNASQASAVGRLFENRFGQVVIEFRGEVRTFGDWDKAMRWVVLIGL